MLDVALLASLPEAVTRHLAEVEAARNKAEERAKQEAKRAKQEAKRAKQEAKRAKQEAERAKREEERVRQAEIVIKHLREMLRLERIKKYGPGSEKLSDAQLELLESEPGVSPAEVAGEAQLPVEEKQAVARKPRRGQDTMPAHLPREEQVIACPESECICPQCHRERAVIDYEVSQRLHCIPARRVVRIIKREKRACPHCPEHGVITAPLPPQIIEKGIGTNEQVVDVLINKYELHLPLFRQEKQIERECGAHLSRQTMCDWVMQCGFLLQAVVGHLRTDLLAGGYIQADETPIGVQDREKPGANHRGYLWQYSRPGACVIFDYQDGRGRDGPRDFLGDYNGVLQSDGYTAYHHGIGGPSMVHAGCMAHARRKFHEAHQLDPGHEGLGAILGTIGQLAGVERQCREQGLEPTARLAMRQQHSVPLMQKLHGQVLGLQRESLPRSAAGRAASYTLVNWERLNVFLTHGEVQIDNNWAEWRPRAGAGIDSPSGCPQGEGQVGPGPSQNAIRPVVVGRKNWLHLGSKEAGPHIAAILSIFETCHRLGINVREYLLDVLPKLANGTTGEVAALTPAAWQAARA